MTVAQTAATRFDTYVVVDWSARSAPSPAHPSKDAIWIGVARADAEEFETIYVRTRTEAVLRLNTFLQEELAAGRRTLVGFDFPFGYPAGVAARITGEASALALWRWFSQAIEDDGNNGNNRFDVAGRINRLYDGVGPFWGTPGNRFEADVPPKAKARAGADHPPERRACEARAPRAKTVWQLMGAGSVGSQVLMGLPALARLRASLGDSAAIWPFETGLAAPEKPVALVEIYPSLFADRVVAARAEGDVQDEVQVRVTAAAYRDFDAAGDLAAMFEGPADLSADERAAIAREEAWILGLGAPAMTAAPKRPARKMSYQRDPAAIYAASFATVRDEARLDHLPEDLRDVAIRLVHSCGMVDIPNRLAWSDDVAAAARAALLRGAPVLCDCRMVEAGIIPRLLPDGAETVVTLNEDEVPARARAIGNTRSAAAVELWADRLSGAVVVIGNAPTALFHLLEMIDEGAPKPAAILGFPVGFVGAAESKAELSARPRGVPFLTLRGRRGGSAMAAAALNALAGGLS
ncbi:MAG: precorrin-8X methylmutase [Pseudomonadota bacterium]